MFMARSAQEQEFCSDGGSTRHYDLTLGGRGYTATVETVHIRGPINHLPAERRKSPAIPLYELPKRMNQQPEVSRLWPQLRCL